MKFNNDSLKNGRSTASDIVYVPITIQITETIYEQLSTLTPRYSRNGMYAEMLYVGAQLIKNGGSDMGIRGNRWYLFHGEALIPVDIKVPDNILDEVKSINPFPDDEIYSFVLEVALDHIDQLSSIEQN